MKRKMIQMFICSLLVLSMLAMSASALAASNAAYLLKVSVAGSPGTYVRSSSGGKVTASLRNGTRVLYWGKKSGQMLKVITSSGKTGYIYQGNLKTYGAMNRKQVYVTKAATGVYKRSGSSLKRAGSARKGMPVIVYDFSGKWALVRNMSGTAGYIRRSALRKLG